IAVACQDTDVRNVKALIVGPPDTPYEFGFFEFAIITLVLHQMSKPPLQIMAVAVLTPTSIPPARSILGTWRGERGEEWSSAQGLESILISIQSLMSSNPYENEPGYENAKTAEDKRNIADYVAKVRHETLRISIIQRLEGCLGIYVDGSVAEPPPLEPPPRSEYDEDIPDVSPPFEPFNDLCKRRFLWYYDSYLQSIIAAEKEHFAGENFKSMPFEGGGNTMSGKFDYPELKRRLQLIRQVLDRETLRWAEEGAVQVKRDAGFAAYLQRQFERMVELYKKNDMVTLDIDLAQKNNPFVWALTYFGRPMTHLDGGMFRIKMSLSPRFPDEQPRVVVETPLFHHRIAKDGTLCYFPKRADELQSHIDAIVDAIEDEHPPYDPRTL
ncbi:MAG: hypothetical protein Q9187_009205, partial [Circinaria calcarea]